MNPTFMLSSKLGSQPRRLSKIAPCRRRVDWTDLTVPARMAGDILPVGPAPVNLVEQGGKRFRPEKAGGWSAENLSPSATCECSAGSLEQEDFCRFQGGKSS
jgi:hypothetical protein